MKPAFRLSAEYAAFLPPAPAAVSISKPQRVLSRIILSPEVDIIMKSVIVNENRRGLLFKNGSLKKLLLPGKYSVSGGKSIELIDITLPLSSEYCTLSKLLENDDIGKAVDVYDVCENEVALRYLDGAFVELLKVGRYAFWKEAGKTEIRIVNTDSPEVPDDIPAIVFQRIPYDCYTRIDVPANYVYQLRIDNKFERLLEAGVYFFWNNGKPVDGLLIFKGKNKCDIMGQEVLTKDKVTVRLSFVCYYTVTDFENVYSMAKDIDECIHTTVQLALRDYIGDHSIDEILAGKNDITDFIVKKLRETEGALCIRFDEAGVKDIILPGEIRDIMNTVLVAEKQAQANVITRREEVASTRSLLNTAKLMDDNATLYRLKELEYVERICQHVDSINLNGNTDLLSQLSNLLSKKH